MIVQNIAGDTRYFTFVARGHVGPTYVRGRTLANSATATLPDNDADVMAKVQAYVDAGLMKVVQGSESDSILTSVNLSAVGYVSCAAGGTSTNDVLTIGGLAFKFAADPGSGVLGTFYASLTAYWAGAASGTPATAMGTLKTAINANKAALGMQAETSVLVGTTAYLPIKATNGAVANTGLTLVKTTGANLAVSGATLAAGVSGGARKVALASYTATSGDVSAGVIVLATPLASVGQYVVQVHSVGVQKAWDGATQLTGGTLILDNSGATDWASGDIISIFAQEPA